MEDFKAAMLYLSGLDDDRATERNDRGFNGPDTRRMNRYAGYLRADRALYPESYQDARQRLQKYAKQVLKGCGVDVKTLPDEMPTADSRSRSVAAKVPGSCAACGDRFPAGEMIDLSRTASGSWLRSHAGGLCPQRVSPEHIETMSIRNDSPPAMPWKDQPARTYEQVFQDENADRAMTPAAIVARTLGTVATPVQTTTGLSVRSILGPGGTIAAMLPGYESRPAQLDVAEAMERAMADGEHLVAEAGTGTGKSLAYLIPAINSGKRTLVSTADKALQGQIWLKDIPFLQTVYATLGRTVRAALLKGRSNYACKFKVNEIRSALMPDFRSPEAGAAWADVSTWIDQQDKAGDVADLEMFPGELPGDLRTDITSDADSCIGKRCPAYDTCFVEEAKRRAEGADLVVVNHALLMRHLAIKAASDGYVTVIPDGNQIVLDEAHHLEDVATDAFGVQITAARWNRLYARLERMTIKHSGATKEAAEVWIMRADAVSGALDTMLETFKKRLVDSKQAVQRLGDDGAIIFPTWQALSGLADDLKLAPAWLAGDEAERDMWTKLQKQTQKLAEDVQAANARELDSEYVRYLELEPTRGNRLVINVKPIDVAEQLRSMLFDSTRTVISTSATISTGGSMAYWRERVGCDEATELEVGSPFNYPKNAMLYLPERDLALKLDSSAARGRDGMAHYTNTLADQVRDIISATTGGVFVLFTSYRMLSEVYDRVAPQLDGLVLRQGDANRGRLVERFKAAHAEGIRAVLFGTKSFTEGVDVQGDALSVVIVDKFVFAPPGDPIWEARKDKITRETNNEWAWFNRLAVPYATIALKQAVGRLIRTTTDKGIVAVLDGRAVTKRYGESIINALPPFGKTNRLADVQAFFGRRS